VLFTSGTTGAPKGVVCSHAWAFAYGALVTDSLRRTAADVVTCAMPLFHSGGLHVVVHSALHAGCRAHVWSRFSASAWWQQVADDGATQAQILGPMAEMVLRRVERAPRHRLQVDSNSALAPSSRAEFARRYGVAVLWQGYGMTEVYPIPMPRTMAPGPDDLLGVPVDRYELGVVDGDDRPVAAGAVGELVVRPRQPGLRFDGYLDDPAVTAHAWRGGAFHTGDLVSLEPATGALRFRGRRADRIRRRGENVDPVVVEDAALAFPGGVDAAAFGVPSDLGDDDVKLDVVAAVDGPPIDLAALRDRLAARLARPAVPRYVEQRTALPRNASHRVDRGRLREDGVDRAGVLDGEAPPQPGCG
jgi:crotonobetaine/carnitine-CoA ligase